MTHYHSNKSFRSDLAEAEILYKASEIKSPQLQVDDRQTQNDRQCPAIPHVVWKVNASGWATYLGDRWEEYAGEIAETQTC